MPFYKARIKRSFSCLICTYELCVKLTSLLVSLSFEVIVFLLPYLPRVDSTEYSSEELKLTKKTATMKRATDLIAPKTE